MASISNREQGLSVRQKLNAEMAAGEQHRASDGKSHSDVVLNNTHRSSDGTDHIYIDQDVRSTASPSFVDVKKNNISLLSDLAVGNLSKPLTKIKLMRPSDLMDHDGNIEFLASGNRTYIDRYGVLQTAEYDNGTPTSTADTNIADTGKSWTVNQWEYAIIEAYNGVTYEYRVCTGNTATKLFVRKPFTITPTSYKVSAMRFEKEGFKCEGASTNNALHSRDLTNAAWVKTSCTAAKDATGLDGVANSASTLTATGASATCLQTITNSSEERTYSVDIRRKTGTGTIEITMDNGTSWTDITSLINSSTYTRLDLTQTVTNSVFGFRITTSGDEIEVDFNQNETGSIATSRIATTTTATARAADIPNYRYSGNFPGIGDPLTMIVDYICDGPSGAAQRIVHVTGETFRTLTLFAAATTAYAYYGPSQFDTVAVSIDTKTRLGLVYDGANVEVSADGVLSGSSTPAGTPTGTATKMAIGQDGIGTFPLYGHIACITIYDQTLTDSEVRIA